MESLKQLGCDTSVEDYRSKTQIISIIVPVYNVAPYLERCVESLVYQTYSHMEIILIDDGSTDNSGSIADNLSETYDNVIVIHQENRGVSAARNAGLQIARGEFIGFVDPDDYVNREMYQHLYDKMQMYGADVAACTWASEYEGSYKVIVREGIEAVLDSESAIYYDLHNDRYITWNKLFSRKTCYNVFYDEAVINGEDRIFDVQSLLKAEKVVYVNKPFYHYCHRINSAGTKKYTRKDASLLKACNRINGLVAGKGERLKNVASLQLVKAYIQLIDMMDGDVDKYVPDGRTYLKEVRKSFLPAVANSAANCKFMIRLALTCLSPRFCYRVKMFLRKIRGI